VNNPLADFLFNTMPIRSLESAFDPDHFRKEGHALVDLLGDYLERVQRKEPAVLPWVSPDVEAAFWKEVQFEDSLSFWQTVLARSIHLHHPRYMGHQTAVVANEAALAALVSAVLNNGMAVYEMGAVSTAQERILIGILAEHLGLGTQSDGFFTSGGTIANLTALLTARAVKAQQDVWEDGTKASFALMVSDEAHYCIDRAVRIMGWGREGIIRVPTNPQMQMDVAALPALYETATASGKKVIAIVGSAGSTSTGAFDPLEVIADFAEQHNLWFHVDGAHGAASAFSETYKPLLAGIHRADSVAMDFHKLLGTSGLVTALVYRTGVHSYQTFAQRADYLLEQTENPEWYNLGRRTLECTKNMMVLRAFALYQMYGTAFFANQVEVLHGLAKRFAQLVRESTDFTLCIPPQTNIVCFRYEPSHVKPEQLAALNREIRQKIVASGTFYLVQTQVKGQFWLRLTLMNPLTSVEDLQALLSEIRQVANEIHL